MKLKQRDYDMINFSMIVVLETMIEEKILKPIYVPHAEQLIVRKSKMIKSRDLRKGLDIQRFLDL